MRLLITLTILTICLTALGQTSPTKKSVYVDTEVKYTDSAGKGVVIQNSLPKGGGGYIHSSGKTFSYVIFWTRVINQTTTPLELSIHFPADSLTIFPSPDSYLKVFLPPDTMTINKESLYDYGLTGLKSFLDTAFGKPTMLHRIINPKEECLFYIVRLANVGYNGAVRAGLVLQEKDLFYRINMLDSLIPCGHIVFKK